MHLGMKTQCEKCGSTLLADGEAYLCSYECTFCRDCTLNMNGVCPNCGGELVRRPQRKTLTSSGENRGLRIPGSRRPWLIWVVSFGVWTFMALVNAGSMYQFDRSVGRYVTFTKEITLPLINYVIYAFLTPVIFGIAMRYPIQRTNWVRRTGLHAVASVAFTVGHVVLRGLVYPVWDPRISNYSYAVWNPHTYAFSIQWILFERLFFYNLVDDIFSTYLPVVLIAHAVWYQKMFKDRDLRTFELEAQLAKAHLQALKSRLQPHFLFNTLHSISTLMLTDVRAADRMISHLSDLLRMSLENSEIQVTTLSRELEFLTGYLEIEKVRFADRLNIVLDVAPDALDAQIPHLLLQPLVENAVHHGISRRSSGGEIQIAVSCDAHNLYLRIRDNGPGLSESGAGQPAIGLGLRATRERLRTLYGNEHSIDIRDAPEGGVEACVRIPFRAARPLPYEVISGDPESAA
jgi:two-component system, LytTR family, sensor kinase